MRSRAPLILAAALLISGCADDPTAPPPATETPAPGELAPDGVVLDRLAPPAASLRLLADGAERTDLGNGLAHYRFEVRLGPGEYDVVGIHRVVRERRYRHPVRTRGSVFMVPGSGQTFDAIFFRAGIDDPDPTNSAPAYLAAHDIDVWGIDLSYTRVPLDLDDVSFMADWDLDRDVDHTLAAMSIARLIRGLTGQGFARLLGFSYGGSVAYAAAGRETTQRWLLRDIAGIIPVDFGPKTANEDRRSEDCGRVDALRAALASGVYRSDVSGAHFIAGLALNDPTGPSPIFPPPVTNYQAGLLIGTNPGAFWQFVGVEFGAPGVATGLLYADPVRWFRVVQDAGSHPTAATLDIVLVRCDEEDVPEDDELTDISVPVLYVGAGGGFGDDGLHSLGLIASTDVTVHMVSLQPPSLRGIDFGHADLFMANDAADLVWSGIADWLIQHHRRGLGPRWRG